MRTSRYGSLFIAAIAILGGCNSSTSTTPTTPTAAQAADSKASVMQSGGVGVLSLTAPAGLKCVAGDGTLHFKSPQMEFEVWLVRDAKTVDEAIGHVDSQIASEFKDFKPDQTTDLTIAGSPAKKLSGPGTEADDGDPGFAEVIVFKVGDHVFIACTHGEGLSDAGKQGLLALVQTARLP